MKQRMQGVLVGVLATVLLLGTASVFAATTRTLDATYGVTVVVDGVRQNFADDMQPFTANDRTFLPVRGIADALGLNVEWDGNTRTVYLNSPDAQPSAQITPPPVADAAPPQVSVSGGVNAETFAMLRNGMSISEVQNIIGVEPTSETTTEILGTTTTMIMWMGTGFSSITVMFTNGSATSISQMGL